jgi:hypothetical protein
MAQDSSFDRRTSAEPHAPADERVRHFVDDFYR